MLTDGRAVFTVAGMGDQRLTWRSSFGRVRNEANTSSTGGFSTTDSPHPPIAHEKRGAGLGERDAKCLMGKLANLRDEV